MGNRNNRQLLEERKEGDQQRGALVLKNHNDIKRNTIALVPMEDGRYFLRFQFTSTYDCVVTVYFCASEFRNRNNVPVYFHTSPGHPIPQQYKFSSGRR